MLNKLLVVFFLLLAGPAMADVTGKIIGYNLDEKGNILVKSQYFVDGVEVESSYPRDEQGRSYFVSRYDAINFNDMTNDDIKKRVSNDMAAFMDNLTIKTYIRKANEEIVSNLGFLLGEEKTIVESSFFIDKDNDDVNETKITVKTDGSKVESVVIVAPK